VFEGLLLLLLLEALLFPLFPLFPATLLFPPPPLALSTGLAGEAASALMASLLASNSLILSFEIEAAPTL
jgi:hypothetical protein